MNVRIRIKNSTASGNRSGWSKHVTAVDKTKTNGYAFEGEFLNDGEYDLPVGAVIIEKIPNGSAKHGYNTPYVGIVTPEGVVEEPTPELKDWSKDFLTFRDLVAKLLEAGKGVSPRDSALSEIRRLMSDHGIAATELM